MPAVQLRKRLERLRGRLQHLVYLLVAAACLCDSRDVPVAAAEACSSLLPQVWLHMSGTYIGHLPQGE